MDVLVPQMGESVLEGTILEWKVKVGDRVRLNQPLVELMTDKVNVEIPSETEGIVIEILAHEGDVVPVGTRVAVIDDGSGPSKAPVKTDAAPKAASAKSAIGPAVPSAEPIKATGPIDRSRMSPRVKQLVREYSLDESLLVPTGQDGRVVVDDVMRAVQARSASAGFTTAPIPSPATPLSQTPATSTSAPGAGAAPRVKVEIPRFEPLPESQREERIPLAGIRKMISDHMIRSVQTSPHVTTFEDLDLTDLVDYRNDAKEDFRVTYGVNLTFLPFIVKAVCLALHRFPSLNASITDHEIILKKSYNIGIAVAREEGLIVPVIRDADKKTIVELAVEMASLGQKARSNRLTPDDVSGGTFSITNAGMFGATASTPIINQPQVAILGIHAIAKRPWVVNDQIVIRHISTFGLSFDHRLIDGHTAVQFLHRVHEYLADPAAMLLQLR